MDLHLFLEAHSEVIISEATKALKGRPLRSYSNSSDEINSTRLTRLFNLICKSLSTKDLIPMGEYAAEIAEERYDQGFDLEEVIAAFNVMEEVIWEKITHEIEPKNFPEAFGMTSTVIGYGKEQLSVTYVKLVSHKKHLVSLDMSGLFQGV